jgi:hypothetical protein
VTDEMSQNTCDPNSMPSSKNGGAIKKEVGCLRMRDRGMERGSKKGEEYTGGI